MKSVSSLVVAVASIKPTRLIAILVLCAVALIFGKSASDSEARFHSLGAAAVESFAAGDLASARVQARELLRLSPRFRPNWNYGNAVHDANLVLGRVAVTEERIDDAKTFLIAAGMTPGSPQLESFGPDMSLAQDLLLAGEPAVVLEYFDLCQRFWEMDRGALDRWRKQVQSGEVPDFDAILPVGY